MKIISLSTYNATTGGVDGLQSLLNGLTGNSPSGDRYISVDQSQNVIGINIADPVGCNDATPHSGASFIANVSANRGDLYLSGNVLPNVPVTSVSISLKLSIYVGRPEHNRLVPLM